jgi:hypothetical protein
MSIRDELREAEKWSSGAPVSAQIFQDYCRRAADHIDVLSGLLLDSLTEDGRDAAWEKNVRATLKPLDYGKETP